jgi:hypothetical protein
MPRCDVTTVELRYTSIVQSEHDCVYHGIATVGLFKANERSVFRKPRYIPSFGHITKYSSFSVVDPLNTARKRHSKRKMN